MDVTGLLTNLPMWQGVLVVGLIVQIIIIILQKAITGSKVTADKPDHWFNKVVLGKFGPLLNAGLGVAVGVLGASTLGTDWTTGLIGGFVSEWTYAVFKNHIPGMKL